MVLPRLRPRSTASALRLAASVTLSLGLAASSFAAERRAASPSRADVGATLDACVDGDTLVIPAGTATWTQTLYVNKAITIKGAGIGNTIILDNINKVNPEAIPNTNYKEACIGWTAPPGGTCRLTGIDFRHGGRTTQYYNGVVQISGSTDKWRIDHCRFQGLNNRSIYVWGGAWGVVDNCEFDTTSYGRQIFFFQQTGQYGGVAGNGAWANPVGWGTNQAMFIEDCTFVGSETGAGITDGVGGSKFVVRHNNITNLAVGNHGTESGAFNRGTRLMEVYHNTFNRVATSVKHAGIDFRSGTGAVHNNTFLGNYQYPIKLNNYRNFHCFPPWGSADGTMEWDVNDKSDGLGTPGGAGDGVFEAGTATGGGTNMLEDSRKSWTPDQWQGYVLRQVKTGNATSGGDSSLTVSPSPGWATNQWARWEVTKLEDNTKAVISSNTADTIITSTHDYIINFSGGGAFTLSRASEINGNTATTIINKGQGTYIPNHVYGAGAVYEIRKVIAALDQPGRGVSLAMSPTTTGRLNHQDVRQGFDPIYQWNNTHNGSAVTIARGGYMTIVPGRDYFDNITMPGYTTYTYPHPLRTGGDLGAPENSPLGKVKNPKAKGAENTN